MVGKKTLGVSLVLVAAGLGAVLYRFDDIHWAIATRVDVPSAYAWHAQSTCAHAAVARTRHHDTLWARASAGEGVRYAFEYVRSYPEGVHVQEANVFIDDHAWETSRESGMPWAYLQNHPVGRHAAEAKGLRQELVFQQAERASSVEAYRSYLVLVPDGPHVVAAKQRIEDLMWDEARDSASESVLRDYLALNPDSPHVSEARTLMEDATFETAVRDNPIDGLVHYLEQYPNGRRAAEARSLLTSNLWEGARAAVLRWRQAPPSTPAARLGRSYVLEGSGEVDDATHYLLTYLASVPNGEHATEARALLEEHLWTRAVGTEAIAYYQLYAQHFPAGQHAGIAREAAEGVDIADLNARGAATVTVTGSGITAVGVHLETTVDITPPSGDPDLVSDGVTVRIPAGTYFSSGNEGVQNMISYKTVRVRLHGSKTDASEIVDAACANHDLSIPKDAHAMSLAGPAPSSELASVAKLLDREAVPYPVAQAAIWIVTDNAGTDQLRTLVRGPYGGSGEPVIKPADMARGFELCWRAGIDVKNRAMWEDRLALRVHVGPLFAAVIGPCTNLLEAVQYGTLEELKAWLESTAATTDEMLFLRAMQRGDEAVVRLVAAKAQDLDELLRYALSARESKWSLLMLEMGASPVKLSSTGLAPLDLAAQAGFLEIVKLLLARGARVEGGETESTALGYAAANDQLEIARELLARGAQVDAGDLPPLSCAVDTGSLEMVTLLLEKGADPKRRAHRPDALPPLALACAHPYDDVKLVQLLLARGADPDAGSNGNTPLGSAVAAGCVESARALIAAGAKHEDPALLEVARARLADVSADPFPVPGDIESAREMVTLLTP